MRASVENNKFHGIQQQVYRSILESIVELEIPPGTKLTIGKLKSIYGVSSTPVRGALYKLKEDGLLMLGPSKSFYVKPIDDDEVKKLFSIRLVLEKLALEESLDRIDKRIISNLIVRMRENLSRPEQTMENVPYDIDYKLHRAILENSGNGYLIEIMQKISMLITRMRNVIKYYLPEQQKNWIICEMEEHLEIAEGVLEGDLEKSCAALENHLAHSTEIICLILGSSKVEYVTGIGFSELEAKI